MNTPEQQRDTHIHSPSTLIPMPDDTAEAVFKLAVVKDQRSIDRLLDILATNPADDHLAALLNDGPWPDALPNAHDIATHGAHPDHLTRLKDLGKQVAAAASTEHERMQGAARYALAVAAALAHHRARIGSASPQFLLPLMADFADVTISPWRAVFENAADACRKLSQSGHEGA